MRRRLYFRHRRAYAPKLWPLVALGAALSLTTTLTLNLGPLPALVVGVAIGWFVVRARWWYWRRRHPKITPQQWRDDLRRAAPWN